MTENSKELVSLAMQSIIDGIPLTGTFELLLRDATAAILICSMEGLLRRVRHIELFVRATFRCW